MPIEVLMPALSPTMTEGKLAKWLKQEGDAVKAGDVLAEIETDKATMEIEAVDEGKLGKILVAEGSEGVAVNTPIALLLGDGESASALAGAQRPAAAPVAPAPAAAAAAPAQPAAKAPLAAAAASAAPRPAAPAAEPEYAGPTRTQTVREALRDAMAEEMRRDASVFLMGEEVAQYQGAYKVSQGLLEEFGERRVIDTPITEQGFTGLGVGAAFNGLRPIVEFMTFNFAMQAIDQIVNSAAKTRYMSGGQMNCPIVFRGPNGAAARVAAQHSQCYASWYRPCAGPQGGGTLLGGRRQGPAQGGDPRPEPGHRAGERDPLRLQLRGAGARRLGGPHRQGEGRARRQRRHHRRLLPHGPSRARRRRSCLAKEGISAEVINLRTIRPLDAGAIVASLKKTNRLVTVEEGWPFAGIGAELAAVMMEEAFDWLDAPVARVAGVDVPMPYAANLEQLALPHAATIVEAAKQVCYRS